MSDQPAGPSILDHALAYAARGWPVFPCDWRQDKPPAPGEAPKKKKAKSPLVPGADIDPDTGKKIERTGGCWRASTDPDTIRAWWKRYPKALIGVPTGARVNAFVIDLDPRDGETVEQVEARLLEAVGPLPPGPRSRTQSGGMHLWFRLPFNDGIPKNSAKRLKGIDWRGTGGYVIAPPSVMDDGLFYEWIIDAAEFDLPAPTAKLLDLVYQRGDFAPAAKAADGGAGGAYVPSDRRGTISASRDAGDKAVRKYALAALDRARADMASTAKGARGHTLNAVAYAMAPFVECDALSEREVVAALRDAADVCGLTATDGPAERDATIKRGLIAGAVNAERLRTTLDRIRQEARDRAGKGAREAGQADKGAGESGSPGGDDAPPPDAPPPDGAPAKPKDESDGCPVRPIGHRQLVYYFISPSGELIPIGAGAMNARGIIGLFDGEQKWLRENFPAFNQHGEPTGGWSDRNAMAWLIRQCRAKGLYDEAMPLRRLGVWRHGEGGPVSNCGDVLVIADAAAPDGWRVERAGVRWDNIVYETDTAIARPATAPATRDEGREIVQGLASWAFVHSAGPMIVAGWCAVAMLGGWPLWHPMAGVWGPPGSGKSTMIGYLKAALGGQATIPFTNITEAFLRQIMQRQARAILLDEQEGADRAGPDAVKAEKVIAWLRDLSGADGANTGRGSAGGKAQLFQANGLAFLGAVAPPEMVPADRSRWALSQLGPLDLGADVAAAKAAHAARMKRAAELSPALRARMILGAGRYTASLKVLQETIMALPAQPRVADQYGSLLAGYWTLTRDEALTAEAAKALVGKVLDYIDEAKRVDVDESVGHECLNALFSAPLEAAAGSKTVGEGLLEQNDEKLARIGIRRMPEGLALANKHAGLDRVLAATRWAGGRWARVLRTLEGAKASAAALNFAGAKSRATILPASYMPEGGPPGDAPPPGEGGGDQ